MSVLLQKRFNFGHALIARSVAVATLAVVAVFLSGHNADAQTSVFKQAVATASANDKAISTFYAERDYRPIWTGTGDRARRQAFVAAAAHAPDHGLPTGRYDARLLKADFAAVKTARGRAYLEVETTRRFLRYAHDIQSGILDPNKLSDDIAIKAPRRDRLAQLRAFSKSAPAAFIRALPPKAPEYARLLKEKARLEKALAAGDWGAKVRAKKLRPGRSGPAVAILRQRLTAMGYGGLGRGGDTYDDATSRAVQQFQTDRGLKADGVAGQATIRALNVSAQTQLKQVVIGLERQRWFNFDLGARYILVNQAAFKAYVIDNDRVTLQTRVVVGKAGARFRTPEFNDKMTYMVINPSWYVPQSIIRREYLPKLQKDSAALNPLGIEFTDANGQKVSPASIDFSQYGLKNFPFSFRQPPGPRNALGKVKFMFPNKFNIYLHDTPSKSLFNSARRAFSHGCVRVQKPFQLAYTLLGRQSSNPKALFAKYLNSGRETRVNLKQAVPVYLTYKSVWISADGRPNYRMDVYGRDKLVFGALQNAGVVLPAVRS